MKAIQAKDPKALLLWMTFVMSLVFAVWQALLNNFVIEKAQFTGAEIGMLQSLREIPGFLAFTAIFVLLLLWRGVYGGRGLLVDSHAELLDVCELALHSGHGGCLALH